jgi:hypothetical protein
MAGHGVPQRDIGLVLGIGEDCLCKHYPQELARGRAKANAKVAETLFRRATDPKGGSASVAAAIFWLKARCGWSEKTVVDQIVTLQGKRAEDLTDDELAAIIASGRAGLPDRQH